MTCHPCLRRLALRFARGAFASWLTAAAAAALAHDTWFETKVQKRPGDIIMALGTGNQFPDQEYPIGVQQVRGRGCRQGGSQVPLVAVGNTSTALILRAKTETWEPVSCWAQLIPFDIELPPDKIEIYLKEINAPRAVREAWAAMQSRGLPWKERYTKHARIEFAGDAHADPATLRAQPIDMGMDVVLESGLQPIRAGDPVVFQVLRDGAPLADFAVELRSDHDRLGLWLKTDAQGRVRVQAPLPGRWVLRGTDLRVSKTWADTWESRFVTLAFEVGAALR